MKKLVDLADIEQTIANCSQCNLSESRTKVVPGEGAPDAQLMLVGERPGEEEDRTGKPFVGKAGKKLSQILDSVSIAREEVYLTNLVKCRPNNRDPHDEERVTCLPFLEAQVAIINPDLVITLGRVATQTILQTEEGITSLRGKLHFWRSQRVLPMYHPSYLLRKPSDRKGSPKWQTWQDIQNVQASLTRDKVYWRV